MRIERIVSPVPVTTVRLQHNFLGSGEFVIQNCQYFVIRVTKKPKFVKPGMSYVDSPRRFIAGCRDSIQRRRESCWLNVPREMG